jgi:hypothetical protein
MSGVTAGETAIGTDGRKGVECCAHLCYSFCIERRCTRSGRESVTDQRIEAGVRRWGGP